MMVMRQKMIVFASSMDFTTPLNILERYSLKNHFKKLQIPKIPPWHKEGLLISKNELHQGKESAQARLEAFCK